MAGTALTLLGGTDVRRCVRRVHNENDPTLETAPWTPSPELQLRFDRGNDHEDDVFATLIAALPAGTVRDLSRIGGKTDTIAATLAAMDDGVDLVLGGWLPDDADGGRKGRPDVLVRHGDHDGRSTYLPGDVKWHFIAKAGEKGGLRYSVASAPTDFRTTEDHGVRFGTRSDDYLQIAHYWRMLEAIGRAPTGIGATGCIIGTDVMAELGPERQVLVWLDLEAELFATFSRTSGKTKRSALERYDHEFGFRLTVAQNAALATEDGGPAPLVEPIFTDACHSCPWQAHCATKVDPDLASLRITEGKIGIREWQALAAAGMSTVGQLAALDPADPAFLDAYLPEVANVRNAKGRLRDVVRRAQMLTEGVSLVRTTDGPIDLERADIEIDVDIEWGQDSLVYLWGARVNRVGAPSEYVPFVSWDVLDDSSEKALALAFVTWLRELVAEAGGRRETVRVFHYAPPETNALTRILGADQVADVLALCVDLNAVMRKHFFGLNGLGLKAVVPVFGFTWEDDDAGGLQSQTWLVEAVGAHDPVVRGRAQERLLQYNADDVAATAVLREGLAKNSGARKL